MIVRWPSVACAMLTVAACGQPAAVIVARENEERAELLMKMGQHPSLAGGGTRKGSDIALLPPPRFPDPQAHQHHSRHEPHGK